VLPIAGACRIDEQRLRVATRLFRDKLAGPLDCQVPWHGLSPGDMPFEAKRSRHVAVAIPEVCISGGVATGRAREIVEAQRKILTNLGITPGY
jgi:hypothetical protein